MIELRDLRKKLEVSFVVLVVVVACMYGIYRAYPLIAGPSIEVFSPVDGDIVASSTFKVIGQVKRAKIITLQGRPITIDTEGGFTETLVASYPYTILVLSATDTYGKTIIKTLRVVPE